MCLMDGFITSIQKRRLGTSVNIPSVSREQFCALYALCGGVEMLHRVVAIQLLATLV